MEQQYVIHNVSRARHNRAARAALPQNPRMKQYVGAQQQRVVRGHPIIVSSEMVQKNLEELRAKHAAHIIELRTRDGRLVDLATLEAAPAGPIETKAHPRLDSVANDRNFPVPEGFKFVAARGSDDATMPQLVKDGEKPALLQQAEVVEPSHGEEGAPVVAAAESVAATEEPAAVVTTDAELDAALEAAQAEASEEPAAAPPAGEDVSSEETTKKGRRNRR